MMPESLSPIANHLWQSTLFAGLAGLLTLALRKNSARLRHWVWAAAQWSFWKENDLAAVTSFVATAFRRSSCLFLSNFILYLLGNHNS